MRYLLFIILFVGCMENKETGTPVSQSPIKTDSVNILQSKPAQIEPKKVFQNARFRNVVVQKTNDNDYRVTGEGQIFEASFNWVIEDGHNELDSGYVMTDAGAPAWGNFDFNIKTSRARANSTLHLILFEISAEDGRRVHELPILLK